ncbi:MAG TPA: hypothetical protein VEI97_01040, partial [bacterium]|nr:hypothetical protein [bacterium]
MPDTAPRLGPLGRVIAAAQPYWARSVLPPEPRESFQVPAADLLRLAGTLEGGICCLFPTHARRDLPGLAATLERWIGQLQGASHALGIPVGVAVAVQYRTPPERAKAEGIAAALAALPHEGLAFVYPAVLNSCIKADSVNAGHAVSAAAGAAGTMWIDDDVVIEDCGVETLFRAFMDPANGGKTAFGLARRIVGTRTKVAKVLEARRSTKRAQQIPYGCCLLVREGAGVLPMPGHLSDDQWASISQLVPGHSDPFARFCIVQESRVEYCLPETVVHNLSRMRRTYTNCFLALATAPPAQGELFMRQVFFGGLRRPASPGAWPRYLTSLAVRGVSWVVWATYGTSLAVRGAINRPIRRPVWAVRDTYATPLSQQDRGSQT